MEPVFGAPKKQRLQHPKVTFSNRVVMIPPRASEHCDDDEERRRNREADLNQEYVPREYAFALKQLAGLRSRRAAMYRLIDPSSQQLDSSQGTRTTPAQPFQFMLLSLDIVLKISDYLDASTLSALSRTCSELHLRFTPVLYDRLLITRDLGYFRFGYPADQRDFLLLQAVEKGSLTACRFFLAVGADPNVIDCHPMEWSALMIAICTENAETACALVSLLLEAGADPLWKSTDGFNAMHVAAMKGVVEVVKILWSCCRMRRISIDLETPYRQTPLHLATCHRRTEVIKFLLEKGADPTIKDDKGDNPLWCALNGKALDCAALMLDALQLDREKRPRRLDGARLGNSQIHDPATLLLTAGKLARGRNDTYR
ncbi:ankyrin repeat-containing domain protein [Sphaerosporella brunnea]|uniref:Ankyrin repeat-containing domain protein n=1 Tax=Sphaerosporella brunnea TaxID=1250544 RepID=A0A5J5EKE1_9PEZI|nr:ankyrin repeat-containing domain protein [Sphaerosporella brunnea]